MCPKMVPKTMKIKIWRGSGRSRKRPWHENDLGACLGRFWPILDRRGMPKMAARWPNLAPRWSQGGANMAKQRAWVAILRPIGSYLAHFRSPLGRSLLKWLTCKNEHHYGVLATFSGLGVSSLGLSSTILATCWAILGSSWELLGKMLVQRCRGPDPLPHQPTLPGMVAKSR